MTRPPFKPGTWSRAHYLNSNRLSLTVVDDSHNDVAHVTGWVGDPDYADERADLIAAAPDLLAACEAALNDIRQGGKVRAEKLIAATRKARRA